LAGIKSEGTTVDDSSNPVQIGDYVLIAATGDTTSSLFVILHIVQASGGTIEGEGVPEKVAFKVIVPLDIDFALDPGELNIDGNHIFGADYRVINKTPSYAVQVKFDVTKPSKAGTIANLLPGTSFASSDIKQSKINVVNAASVVLNSSSTELETASYDSAESGAVAIGLDTARRTVAVGAADADTNASTPVSTVFELDKYGTTDSPATTLSTANVGAFTLRGELNRPETLDYKSGDVELVAAYSFKGVGAKKYASDVPALQGANAKPMEIANYGFSGTAIQVAATGVQGATAGTVDNAKHTDKLVSDNPVAGEFTINIAKATGFTANTQFALLNGGSKVKTVWYGEPGNDFFDNTATMTIDETSTPGTSKLKFQSGWYGTGDDFAGTYYQYVELENGDIFMITIVVS
jgi:hypothetical protein